MASIPLPALDIKPPAPTEGPLDQYKSAVQLKTLMGNQQTQQLQQQAMTQENQQRQIQIDDQNAVKKAMLSFDPKKHDMIKDLPNLVIQSGGSPQSAYALQEKLIESQTKLNGMKKDQIETLLKTHDALAGKLQSTLDLPDDKVADSWQNAVKSSVQEGLLQPEEAQQYAQFPGRDSAKILLNSLKGSQQQAEQAKSAADTREKNATAGLAEIKLKLANNSDPTSYANYIDSVIPKSGNPGLNLRTKSAVQFSLSRGDVESAQKAINEGMQQVNSIEKEINPQVQAGKVKVARAEGQARADIAAAQARGSDAALSEVPPHLVPPATKDYAKAGEEFATAHQASQNLHDFLAEAKSGNKSAVKIVPLQGALEITTAQGVHRINRTEVDQFAGAGSLYDHLAGKIGGILTGKSITDSVLNDMSALQSKIDANAKTMHANKVKTINKTYGSKFEPMNFDDDTGGDATTSKGSTAPKSYADQFPVHK